MIIDDKAAYRALTSRDPRFDGLFFVGVTSTGIYCRPVCPAKTPRAANCRFFASAEAAEKESFRPCMRCRPELAPGRAPIDNAQRIAGLIADRMNESSTDAGASLETVAAQVGLSSRQLRRIVQKEFGVSPIELVQTRRLLLAKQLLTETGLPVNEIAFASGYASLRRFNDAFTTQYRMPPTRLRREAVDGRTSAAAGDSSTVRLSYRPPYDWQVMLQFLSARATREVEYVSADCYSRTVCIGEHRGWIRVTHAPATRSLMLQFSHTLTPVLPALLCRVRSMFDLSARPDIIAAHLAKDKRLKPSVRLNPGLRVPGAFDGFELAVRAILGQQVSVKVSTTIACRFAAAFGETMHTPFPELTRLSPRAERIARASRDEIASLGIVSARANSIISLAREIATGLLRLDDGANPESTIEKLVALPGIGQWTAQYIAMRALRWPDAFPKEDIVIRRKLGGVTAKQAEEISQSWHPWCSYAVLHLWRSAG